MKKIKFYAGLESHNPAIKCIPILYLPKFKINRFPKRNNKN